MSWNFSFIGKLSATFVGAYQFGIFISAILTRNPRIKTGGSRAGPAKAKFRVLGPDQDQEKFQNLGPDQDHENFKN